MDKQDKVYKDMLTVLSDALKDLERAVKELQQPTVPSTPMPRPKFFHITDLVVWPYFQKSKVSNSTFLYYTYVTVYGKGGGEYRRDLTSDDLPEKILSDCEYQPAKVLRALRRIQAATEWCRRRVDGRRRAAEEILRQQQKAVEDLEAEAAMTALKG